MDNTIKLYDNVGYAEIGRFSGNLTHHQQKHSVPVVFVAKDYTQYSIYEPFYRYVSDNKDKFVFAGTTYGTYGNKLNIFIKLPSDSDDTVEIANVVKTGVKQPPRTLCDCCGMYTDSVYVSADRTPITVIPTKSTLPEDHILLAKSSAKLPIININGSLLIIDMCPIEVTQPLVGDRWAVHPKIGPVMPFEVKLTKALKNNVGDLRPKKEVLYTELPQYTMPTTKLPPVKPTTKVQKGK